MRRILLFALLMSATALKAQTLFPGSFMNNNYRGSLANAYSLNDSSAGAKKWSVSKYASMMTSFSFFNGGSASMFSVPVGLQLNRRLTNNLYAFAGVSVAPSYISFGRSFMASDFNKTNPQNSFLRPGNLGLYSRAELGLQYVNDDRTFSISGSIGVQRSSYPMFPYNPGMSNQPNQSLSSFR